MRRLLSRWIILLGLFCAASAAADNTSAVTGLLEASLKHGWLDHDRLTRWAEAISGDTANDPPQVISPFNDLSLIDQKAVSDQLQRLLTEDTVDWSRVRGWIATVTHVKQQRDTTIRAHSDHAQLIFARVPEGRMVLPMWVAVFRDGPLYKLRQKNPLKPNGNKIVDFSEFELMSHPVTEEIWSKWMGRPTVNPRYPITNISCDEISEFITQLNRQKDGYHYWLPTEVQWLYAYTNGGREPNTACWDESYEGSFLDKRFSLSKYGTAPDGSDWQNFLRYGWFENNSNGHPHPVGQREPIMLRHPKVGDQPLWDMPGNVGEMTWQNIEIYSDFLELYERIRLLGGSFRDSLRQRNTKSNPWEQIADNEDASVNIAAYSKEKPWRSPVAGFRLARNAVGHGRSRGWPWYSIVGGR